MRVLKFFTIAFLGLFLGLGQAIAAQDDGPALWVLEDEDTTIFIFGTIHLMNEGINWNTEKIKGAFEKAQILVVEAAPDQLDPALILPLTVKHGIFQTGQTLPEVVSPETYQRVQFELQKIGAPLNSMDNLKPWLAASFISVQKAQKEGFLPELGVDITLMELAKEKGKKIHGLETANFQFGVFSNLALETQALFLEETMRQIEDVPGMFEVLRDAWLNGDLETLDEQLNSGWENFPDLREALLDNRNRNWAEELEEMLALPGTFFVAVGTGHLVGHNNLVDILEKRGFEIGVR